MLLFNTPCCYGYTISSPTLVGLWKQWTVAASVKGVDESCEDVSCVRGEGVGGEDSTRPSTGEGEEE